MQKEEERLKASIRRENQQRRVKEKASQRLNSNYLEDYDDDDENAVSLSAIKKQHKQNITDIKRMFAFLDESFLAVCVCTSLAVSSFMSNILLIVSNIKT